MKPICRTHHNGAALAFCSALILAFGTFQAEANPFNDGTSTNITSNVSYGETLYIGIQNPDNDVTISSNAIVSATDIILGDLTSSTNNSLSVTDNALVIVGNADTNGLLTGGIVIGDAGTAPSLSIDNDATVNSDYLYVGFGTNDSGSVELMGEGSELNISNDAFIGYAGSTNSIDIRNGAAMNLSGNLTVGSISGSNNVLNVHSDGSVFVGTTNNINVVNAGDADNGIFIKGNGTLKIGGDVDTSTLDDSGIDLAKNANLEVGGSLAVEGNAIENSLNIILNNDLSANTAHWQIGSIASIGDTTSNNSLTLTNGATATAGQILRIGNRTTSTGNSLIIGGTNSILTAQQDVFVGAQGKNNELSIYDGGQATIAKDLYLGNNATATGNEVNVQSNGVLNVSGKIYVGDNGNGNTFNINHGTANVDNDFILGSASINNRYFHTGGTNTVAGEFIIGKTENATGKTTIGETDTTGNLGSVGEGATLNIQQNLTVGKEGGGSILLIHDGGAINIAGDAIIGEASDDNYIFLEPDDPDSRFNVAGNLVVGKEGGNNRFAVYGGTANIDGNLYLGSSTNQHVEKNYIHIETTNAILNVANAIYIGASNSINTLDLVAGATVRAQDLFVGTYEGVSNNVVTVTGDDSLLSISNKLAIGSNNGSNNAVNVSNGGILFVLNPTNIVIGATATNDLNNRLNVNSGGTLQTLDWDFATISSNILLNGGSTLELSGMFSGTNRIDGGIEIALNGTNAAWENILTNRLYIGFETDGNTLTVENGAFTATSTNLVVGNSSRSTDNTLSVTGLSSRVEVGGNLIIGNVGSSGNDLEILGGGRVDVINNVVLGNRSGDNIGLIEGFEGAGSNSVLEIAKDLTIGSGVNGNNNELNISSNALVNVGGIATVGRNSNNNTLELEGSNAVFNVGSNLVVGTKNATGNSLKILDGGKVNVANNLLFKGKSSSASLLRGLEDAMSSLDVTNNLIIGSVGDGNILTISSNATAHVLNGSTIGSSGNNNELRLTGTNASFIVERNMVVGIGEATGNKLVITEGSANLNSNLVIGLSVDSDSNSVTASGSNSTLNIANDLFVGKEGSENKLTIEDGAFADLGNNAYIGFGTNSQDNAITVAGSNSTFTIANDLYAGYGGEGNSLTISGGATVDVFNAYIGFASSNNWIQVTDSNSTFTVLNNMFVGNADTNISGDNVFEIFNAAKAHIGGNLSLSRGVMNIRAGSQVMVDGNYDQDQFSTLALGISTNHTGTNLVVGGTASFTKDTTIAVYDDDDTVVGVTNYYTQALVWSTNLVIDGQAASQRLLNDSITNDIQIADGLLDFTLILSNNTIWIDNITRLSLALKSDLEDGTQLANVADEIDFMADGSNDVAKVMRNILNDLGTDGRNKAFHDYYGEKESSIPLHNVVNQGLGGIASELTVRGDNTRERMGTASASINWDKPNGAAGPHSRDQELQGWIAGYGSWADKSAADGFDAYDSSLHGFIIGADFTVSKNILVGLAGGSNSGSVDRDNGATGDSKTTYGAIYASAGTKNWFLDGSVIYGSSTIDQDLGDVFDTTADYDAMNLAFYLGGGKEIASDYMIITPQASLLVNYYDQDAYEETSTDAVARSVDGFDTLYAQSSFGCSLGFYMGMGEFTLKPELRAHWLHEFNAKEEDLPYRLVGGNGSSYNIILQAPEEDILKLGAGISAKISEYLEIRFDLDTQQASDYSDYTAAGSFRYQF